MYEEHALRIYVDGSSKSKPRRGGIGIQYVYINNATGDEVSEDQAYPGYMGASNNVMELYACILGLKQALSDPKLRLFRKMIILTDSNYVVDNYKKALFEWPKTKWLRRGGAPVLNSVQWKELNKSIEKAYKTGIRVDIRKVKGHSMDLHNRAVDKLAKKSAEAPLNKPLSPEIVRRKLSKKKTEIGSVGMLGQKITIRVIGGKYLGTQGLHRYRYEVMSKTSPFYRKVDFICSTLILHEGHTYYVRLNKEKSDPRILKLFKEIPK